MVKLLKPGGFILLPARQNVYDALQAKNTAGKSKVKELKEGGIYVKKVSADQNILHHATHDCIQRGLFAEGNTLNYTHSENQLYDSSNPFFKIGLDPAFYVDATTATMAVVTTTTPMDVDNVNYNDDDDSNTSNDAATINTITTICTDSDKNLKKNIISKIDQFNTKQIAQLMEIMKNMELTSVNENQAIYNNSIHYVLCLIILYYFYYYY